MKRLMQTVAALPLFAIGAAAQDPPPLDVLKKRMVEEQQVVKMNMVGAMRGPLVKGMPYSADEITETTQVLGDGTKIHRETKTAVYRDSEGRTRRETPDSVTISDPVAGTTYVVNPKTNAVKKLQTASNFLYRSSGAVGSTATADGMATTFSVHTADGQTNIEVNGKQLDPKAVQELIAKAKAEGSAETKGGFVVTTDGPVAGYSFTTAAPMRRVMVSQRAGESLGKKNIEGVIADGMRNSETIEVGAIGNDRPFQVVNEHWFSEELGMTVYSKHSDPRTGDEIFRVTNIHRGDPPAYLFQAPAETHSTTERKM
jgi:hypothetical protein